MKYISPERATQIKTFDELQQVTHDVLVEPEVQARLGSVAVDLLNLCDNAFLPDVNNGLVVIPPSQIDTENIGILPVGFGGTPTSHYAGESVYRPTPKMLETGITHFVNEGYTAEEVEGFIAQAVDAQDFPVLLATSPQPYAFVERAISVHKDTGYVIGSRPLVVATSLMDGLLPVENGVTIGHELRHVLDHMRVVRIKNAISYMTWLELRAYETEVLIADGLEESGWDLGGLESIDRARDVDALRQKYGTPESPYPVITEIIRGFAAKDVFASYAEDQVEKWCANAAAI